MKVFHGLDEFADATGKDLGTTEWVVIDQEQVNLFAEATGDHQWIHVDPERSAGGPFSGTIAHGLLTLSLLPALLRKLYRVDGVKMAVNYGFDKVRLPAPVPVGSRVRANARIGETRRLDGAVQGVLATTVEVEGSDKPAAVVEYVVRYVA